MAEMEWDPATAVEWILAGRGPYQHATFSGKTIRTCSMVRGDVVEWFILSLLPSEPEAYLRLVDRSGAVPLLDVFSFQALDKRSPAVIYERRLTHVSGSVFGDVVKVGGVPVGVRIEEDIDEFFLARTVGRQKELDFLAHSWRTTPEEDPWFDAAVCAFHFSVWLVVEDDAGLAECLVFFPLGIGQVPSQEVQRVVDEVALARTADVVEWTGLRAFRGASQPGDYMATSLTRRWGGDVSMFRMPFAAER